MKDEWIYFFATFNPFYRQEGGVDIYLPEKDNKRKKLVEINR